MAKKIISLFALIVLISLFSPSISLANGKYQATDKNGTTYDIYYKGFVPCGLGKTLYTDKNCSTSLNVTIDGHTYKSINCQFCHFFIMFNGIVNYVIVNIVPPIAVLMIVIGGIMFYIGGSKPEMLNTAKSLLKGVAIGLFLIYGAYMIIGVILGVLNVAEWTGLAEWAHRGAFQIDCPVTIP